MRLFGRPTLASVRPGETERERTTRPGPGTLWLQAHNETKALPSWERGEACRRRYVELMKAHGHLVPGKPTDLPCGWPGQSRP